MAHIPYEAYGLPYAIEFEEARLSLCAVTPPGQAEAAMEEARRRARVGQIRLAQAIRDVARDIALGTWAVGS